MTIYVPLLDKAADGTVLLDAQPGQVAFLAGLDKPEALAAFDLYQARSARAGAAFDRAALRVTHGGGFIQFAWETDIAIGQDVLWTTVWTELAIEDRLYPSQMLVDALEGIIKQQRVA